MMNQYEKKKSYVKIPESLFYALCRYHLGGSTKDETMIRNELARKMKSMNEHNLYSNIQRAASDEERKKAAAKYREVISR